MIAELQPFTRQTALTDYYPVPRKVLNRDLTFAAVVLYAVLLDRATLSQRTGWTDQSGRIYVIYPIEKLAETLHASVSAIKRHLTELERCGLIERKRPKGNGPSHILLNIPEDSCKSDGQQRNAPLDGAKMTHPTGQKRAANNKRKATGMSDFYYQHKEDESL